MKHLTEDQEQLLTAYALGELDAATRRKIEAEFLIYDEAKAYVEEIRTLGSNLSMELQSELGEGLRTKEKQAIEKELTPKKNLLTFPSWAKYGSLAAAACVAVLLGAHHFLQLPVYEEREEKTEFMKMGIEKPDQTPMSPSTMGADGLPILSDSSAPVSASTVNAEPVPTLEVAKASSDTKDLRTPLPAKKYASTEIPARASAQSVGLTRGKDKAAVSASRFRPYQDSSAIIAGSTNNEGYDRIEEKPFSDPVTEPLSTFSIDVDTASYSNVRRFLNQRQLPPRDAVRIEEMVNYFHYNYPEPESDRPFSVNVEVSQAPWNMSHLLARIGIKGREVASTERPRASLTFLVDVSGSMNEPNKLPLVVESLKTLTKRLRPDDRVAIVTYANGTNIALSSTSVSEREVILKALDQLSAGGGTNGAGGIQLAYEVAKANFVKNGINRVILATDGDFNIGITDKTELLNLIKSEAKTGVFLNVYGFGMGNLKDDTMSLLSQNGNGVYGYIDSDLEARKVFVEQLSGTLVTIAKDVKIQVEFNPANVASYKLIGYENRMLAARDFNDDKKDAGEIGAGHTVTALYEIVPVPAPNGSSEIDPLKYQPSRNAASEQARRSGDPRDLMTVKLRFKKPDGDVSSKIELPVAANNCKTLKKTSEDFKFAAAVAGFGMILRHSELVKDYTLDDVEDLANESKSSRTVEDLRLRSEFQSLLIPMAKALINQDR